MIRAMKIDCLFPAITWRFGILTQGDWHLDLRGLTEKERRGSVELPPHLNAIKFVLCRFIMLTVDCDLDIIRSVPVVSPLVVHNFDPVP